MSVGKTHRVGVDKEKDKDVEGGGEGRGGVR